MIIWYDHKFFGSKLQVLSVPIQNYPVK